MARAKASEAVTLGIIPGKTPSKTLALKPEDAGFSEARRILNHLFCIMRISHYP